MLNIEDILNILPQRPPFLFIDKVLKLTPGKDVLAIKAVTYNEYFFQGHFPFHPIMPGVILIEAMAQAAAILAYNKKNPKAIPYLARVDKARFRKNVVPGDLLYLTANITARKGDHFWRVQAEALVEDEVVATAELTSCVMTNPTE